MPPPAYLTQRGRDLRLDLLRGACVLVMIVDHVADASPLRLLTGGNLFFTSAAEGFILISGLTAGLVYRRLVARNGLVASTVKALRRAFSLYLLTIGLTLLVAPISEICQLPWARSLDLSRAGSFVVSVLTLHRTYHLADVMLLYTLLFALMPLALLLLERGRARIVLGASWVVWLLYQVYPLSATFTWPIAGGHWFQLSAWQVLFFTALVFGYRSERGPHLAPRSLGRLHLWAGLVSLALIAGYGLLSVPAERLPAQLQDLGPMWVNFQDWCARHLFDKASVGPGRILASTAVYTFLFLSLTRAWQPLARILRPLLQPLGQNALYAYTVHVGVAVTVALATRFLGAAVINEWLNAVLQIGAVVLVWALTRRQFLAVTPRTKRFWYASPAVLAVLTVLLLQLPYFDSREPPATAPPTATPSVSATPSATPTAGVAMP